MATPATIVALLNAARRRRTPRIVKVEVDVAPGGSISVTFDRVMDNVPAGGGDGNFDVRAVIKVFDGVNGDIIVFGEAGGSGWNTDRILGAAESSRTSGYVGPTYAIYMSGNVKAAGRFFANNYTRCDRVEFI